MRKITLVLLLALLGIGNALGEESASVPFEERLAGWKQTIQTAEEALESDFAQVKVAEIRNELQATLHAARQAYGQAVARKETAEERLASLTDTSEAKVSEEKGAETAPSPQETPQLTALRKEMESRVAKLHSQTTQTKLIIDQANALLASVAAWEQARVRSTILKRSPLPFTLQVWRKAVADALRFAVEAVEAPLTWWDTRFPRQNAWRLFGPLLGVLLLGLALSWPARIWLTRRFGRDGTEQEPTYTRRIIAAFADGLANAVIPAALVAVTLLVLYLQSGVLTGLFACLLYAGGSALAAFLMIMGLARAAASPHLVAWRIAPVQPTYVYRLLAAIRGVTASLLLALALLITAYYGKLLTPELESVFFLVQVPVTSVFVIWALAPAYWEISLARSQNAGSVESPDEPADEPADEPSATEEETGTATEEETSPRSWFDRTRKIVRVIMVVLPFLALAGYGRLGFFIQSRLLAAAVLIGFAVLLRLAIGEMIERWLTRRQLMPSGTARKTAEADQRRIKGTMFWIGMAVSLLIFLPLTYLLLLICGIPDTTLRLWIGQLLSGIAIGGVTISLGGLLLAILVLILGVIITNLFRVWLANRVLPHTRLDSGARNSIAAASGYLGIAIVVLIAISTLGVDFSSLALVAGALGVGIGFGLQNVVQNFVAGLLMLIERPVKVGDWIIVGATEGTVKRIAVRSTEIETFDRSSVIVPNSEFISSPVTNWTYENRLARLRVRVGVAYGSDTKKVAATLLRCAQAHRHVLRYPPAAAYFLAFGDSSLNFELRCYVYDTDYYLPTLSDLHFAVDDAFRQEGIEIPFPQRDLHLRGQTLALSPETAEPDTSAGKQAHQ